jgi:hypothetical protein
MGEDTSATLEEAIVATIRELPLARQQEILDYARRLRVQTKGPKRPRKSAYGICSDVRFDITPEELREERREMWKNFPRDFPEEAH